MDTTDNSESLDCPYIHLNSGTLLLHITEGFRAPSYTQTILNNPDLEDTRQHFQQPSLLELTTGHSISVVILCISLCLAFPTSVQQGRALKADYTLLEIHVHQKPLS